MESTEIKTAATTHTSDVPDPVIVMENVQKSFNSHEVLKGIDLTIRKGENLVVLGKSGSGKSVLIKCIVGLITPDAGSLEVLGKNIPELDPRELNDLRKRIGFLFQSAALYDSMTVKENLEFPLKRNKTGLNAAQIRDLVHEALENVGLPEAINKMPSELSGGMRKRIGLARTFILKPDIMLYDEPTTGLDPVTSKEISHLIVDMQQKYGISSIIITHDMPCAQITANRIMVLRDGKFVAEGSYNELENTQDEWVKAFFK